MPTLNDSGPVKGKVQYANIERQQANQGKGTVCHGPIKGKVQYANIERQRANQGKGTASFIYYLRYL
jgi:hypothetical protein